MIPITSAVEGVVDEAVALRLIRHSGGEAGPVYGRQGKAHLKTHIGAFLNAARFSPWMVLVDLDHDSPCAPALKAAWLKGVESELCLRVAVREVESWLMADRLRFAEFLGIPNVKIPSRPDEEGDPKAVVVQLAARSRRTAIRLDIAPRVGSGHSVGPAYSSRLIQFIRDESGGWHPEEAASRSPSLAGCLRAVKALIHRANRPR